MCLLLTIMKLNMPNCMIYNKLKGSCIHTGLKLLTRCAASIRTCSSVAPDGARLELQKSLL
jgi:hypothetical protein